jgi:pyruvate dehydrogenase E2 component (dihydrolipoamide acetyltransferase)
MAKLIKVPVLGQSVEEVRILQWFKSEGDTVAKGEPLVEIETDKVNHEVESQEDGVVRRILAPVDAYVKVEAPLVIVGTADEPIDDLLPAGDQTAAAAAVAAPLPVDGGGVPNAATAPAPQPAAVNVESAASGPVLASPRAQRVASEVGVVLAELAGRGTGPNGRVQEKDVLSYLEERDAAAKPAQDVAGRGPKASPLARAVAGDTGTDLASLTGTGTGGRIIADDVRTANTKSSGTLVPAHSAPPEGAGGEKKVLLTGLRKRVADNIAKSIRNSPHVTLNLQADMSGAMRLRKDLLPAIEKATGGVRVSPTDIIVKACAVALREHPGVNAHIDGDTLTLIEDIHVGLAVSLGEAGLIVPVIKDVNRKGLAQIAQDRQDLAARARGNQLGSADITGGTFTVTNLGNYGIQSFNPIINPPQVAILGVGAITDTVVPVDGVPAVRPMMGLSLSFDHRAMDGAPAAAFLARLKEILETPSLLLL